MRTRATGAVMVVFSFTLFFAFLVSGQSVPGLINYQGRINDSGGLPLDGVTVDMRFAFLNGDTISASILWGETQEDVLITNGLYNVILGSLHVIPPSALSGATIFVELRVAGEIMRPRSRLTSGPLASTARALS